MKKRLITCVIAFIWVVIVAVLVVSDNNSWRNERQTSAYQDGCAAGSRLYLIENMGDEGILYVTDQDGHVQDVTKSGDIWEKSVFGKVAYAEGLYGVLTRTIETDNMAGMEFKVVSFDENGKVLAMTPEFRLAREGVLSGLTVDEAGFYLTLIMDSGEEAGAFFVVRENLVEITLSENKGDGTEENSVPEVLLHELTVCEEGRLIIEARYEDGRFILRKDDGSGVESFEDIPGLREVFRARSLTFMQWLKIRSDDLIFYFQLSLVGFVVLALLTLAMRNRKHTVYTILIVELVLLTITLAGAIQIARIQEQVKDEEGRRFGFYYIQSLVDGLRAPGKLYFDSEEFYDQKEYYEARNQLSRFVNMDEVSDVFMDICLVRGRDHQILVSSSGYNKQKFEEVYAADTKKMLQDMEKGDRKASMTIGVAGNRYQVLGVAASNELYPEYFLIGIIRQESTSGISDRIPKDYLIYTELMFLLGSLVSVVLLLLQDWELRCLAQAMQDVANGETQITKGTVYGRDINLMWNSLLELDKIISRSNYARYQIYESCYRFAPKNIEKILGKDSITEVKGGDMVLMEGTIAILSSAEPEGSKDKTAEQMNHFITQFERYQEKSEGFFISGQCDLAMMKLLFLEEARNTVESGAAFMHEFYEEKSLSTLQTSIFLHYSQFAYGVAGTDIQSFPFLLSAEGQEMERYAAWFQKIGLRLVITESVKNRENLKKETLRYIGYIRIPKMPEQIRVYEVLDACSYRERHLKQITDARFQKGLELFYQHDFYLARSTFSDVLKENPGDHMAKWYLFTCERYLNKMSSDDDICRLRREE